MARGAGARFAILVAPLRPRAEAHFYPAERAALWRDVAGRIAPEGGVLIRPGANASFTDPEFADFAHLNRCGRDRWTAIVADALRKEGL